ncbi:hypothetical protein SLA2020_073120 [Shorea laevis]
MLFFCHILLNSIADEFWGVLCFFHGGTFVPGPPIEYKAAQCTSSPFDCDRLNVGVIMDTIVSFGYEDVMIKNVYYTTIGESVMTLKCLASDDSIRDILHIVHAEGCVDIYVDHEVNFAQLAFPQLCWVDNNVVEEGGRHEERVGEEESGHEERLGEGIDGEVSGRVDEGDLGNITQEYPISSKGNIGNTVEKGECSKGNRGNCGESEFGSSDGYVDDWSSTDDEVKPLCTTDRDDEELIDVKKRARSIRRPTEGLEVPSGLQTPKGVKYKHVAKKPTPRSTPIKKPTTRSTPIKKPTTRSAPVSRGKKVASSDLAELSRLRKEKAKLAKKGTKHYLIGGNVKRERIQHQLNKRKEILYILLKVFLLRMMCLKVTMMAETVTMKTMMMLGS